MRRFVLIATLVLAVSVVFYFWPTGNPSKPPATSAGTAGQKSQSPAASIPPDNRSPRVAGPGSAASNASGSKSGAEATAAPAWSAEDFPIVAPLNAPNATIARDLDVVRNLFDAWVTNFPREGNPVGENADITAALMGDNRLQLVLIPKGHPAVNQNGELCDRWGTPFRFHQISGTRMEIRSAGPDRKFATEDDALLSPP